MIQNLKSESNLIFFHLIRRLAPSLLKSEFRNVPIRIWRKMPWICLFVYIVRLNICVVLAALNGGIINLLCWKTECINRHLFITLKFTCLNIDVFFLFVGAFNMNLIKVVFIREMLAKGEIKKCSVKQVRYEITFCLEAS